MKKLLIIYIITLTLFMLLITNISCQQKGQPGAGDGGAEEDTVAAKAATLRKNWEEKIKAMNANELHQQLVKESLEGMEPFNSMALKEAVSRDKRTFEALAFQLDGSRKSLLTLMALKEIDNVKYAQLPDSTKASILLDALKSAKTFNTFGLPHVRWEAAAQAILDMGDAARRGLVALLDDKRPAPVWGSEDYSEYVRYQYRVCDYALALLSAKGREPVNLPENVQDRDRLIQDFSK